jgi:protein O-mannosyl-transferase
MPVFSITQPQTKWILLGVSVIALAIIVAYWPALNGGFIFDDDVLLVNNKLIQAPDGLYRIWFTSEPIDYWPVTNTAFWIEWRLWGWNTTGYHVVNLVLHIANALLVWLILRKLAIPGSFLAALLFAVHPVNVESVAWISQLKNTLSLFFFLVSILCYLKAKEKSKQPVKDSADSRGATYLFWTSLLAFVLAMLSKGSVAILPLVLLLIVWWQGRRFTWPDFQRILPYFYVAGFLTLVNIWFRTHGSGEIIRSVTFSQRLLGAGQAIWFYLAKALLPINLVFIYPQWEFRTSDLLQWLPLLATIAVTAVLWRLRSGAWGRPSFFAWSFYCAALLPVLGFVDIYYMKYSLIADQYQYIAIIGVMALVAAGCSWWQQKLAGRTQTVAHSVVALGVLVLIFASRQQSGLYRDATTMYLATLNKNPDCWVLHYNLGNALDNAGDSHKAIEHYQQAIRLKPDYVEAHNNLGNTLANAGRSQEAIEQFQEALRLKPDWVAEVHCALGITLSNAGRIQEAVEQYKQALKLKPDNAEFHYDFGNVLLKTGRTQDAIDQYQQAVKLKPDFSDAHSKLGDAFASENQLPQAIEHYEEALPQLKPDLAAKVHCALGAVLNKAGHTLDAIEQYQQALRLKPDYAEAHFNLGNALFKLGRPLAAIEHYQQAVQLNPALFEAENGLGAAFLATARPQEAVKYFEQALQIKPDYFQATANLANAYAQTNHSDEAIATAQKALDMARSQGQTALAQQMEAWLTKYRASLSKTPGPSPNSGQTPSIPSPPP